MNEIQFAREMAVRYASHLHNKLSYDFVCKLPVEDSTSAHHLRWMCHEIIYNNPGKTITKLHRWIGYIQGVMVTRGMTTVDIERADYKRIKEILTKELDRL